MISTFYYLLLNCKNWPVNKTTFYWEGGKFLCLASTNIVALKWKNPSVYRTRMTKLPHNWRGLMIRCGCGSRNCEQLFNVKIKLFQVYKVSLAEIIKETLECLSQRVSFSTIFEVCKHCLPSPTRIQNCLVVRYLCEVWVSSLTSSE